jgi:hypothetical protein
MTLYHGISLILLSAILLIVGMIKPKWILFWMEKPSRMMITGICMIMFMIGAVLFGEGNKQKQQELVKQPATVQMEKPVDDKPDIEPAKPIAPPAPPAQAPTTSANDLRP